MKGASRFSCKRNWRFYGVTGTREGRVDLMDLTEKVTEAFRERFGTEPEVVVQAPAGSI